MYDIGVFYGIINQNCWYYQHAACFRSNNYRTPFSWSCSKKYLNILQILVFKKRNES